MRRRLILFVLLVAISGVVFAQNRQRRANPYSDVMRAFAKERSFSGAALVAREGKILYQGGVGQAQREWSSPNDQRTKFRIGSLTKAFTAAVVLDLQEDGKLRLEDTVSTHLPWYRKDTGDRMTIHHLLCHTSGLPSYTSAKGFGSIKREAFEVAEFTKKHCSDDLNFTPGEKFEYSNSGYFVLGAVIEAVAGKKFAVILQERILDPLGMSNTGYDRHRRPLQRRAAGYESVGGRLINADFLDLSLPYAAGALYSTVTDLYSWHRGLMGDAVLSDVNRALMFTPQLDSYGYGWGIGKKKIDGSEVTVHRHGGGIDGFTSMIVRIPERDECVIVLSNVMTGDTGVVADQLLKVLHGEKNDAPSPSVADKIWRRVHAGDLRGAKTLFDAIPDNRQMGARIRILRAGRQLIEAGMLKDAAAVLRFVKLINSDSKVVAELLPTIESPSFRPPQFVEQLEAIPGPEVWSEGVQVLDLNDDGRPDLIFANCNGWHRPGDMAAPSKDPLFPTLLINEAGEDGRPKFVDRSAEFLPEGFLVHSKNVAVCDVDGDGFEDLVFAVAFGAQPRLLRWDPEQQRFLDETKSRLPQMKLNCNGLGWGDLDDDGDLDLVFADSGPNSDRAPGGKARLLLNDGKGKFAEAADRLPSVDKIGAQNVKVIDIDGDFDLDLIVDGKSTVTQLYLNDGQARFTLDLETIPEAGRGGQPYEIEWADIDDDGDLDAIHMSWGGDRRQRYRNVVLRNRLVESGKLGFDVVMDSLSERNNEDENEFAWLDADDDGDLDLIVATLVSGPVEEKLYLNQGPIAAGSLRFQPGAFSHFVDGTLDLVVADFDRDGAYDIVTAQGESRRYESFANRLYLNTGAKDTRAPKLLGSRHRMTKDGLVVHVKWRDAVADDGTTTVKASLALEVSGKKGELRDMKHVGGGIFRGFVPQASLKAAGAKVLHLSAVDDAKNRAEAAPIAVKP